MNNPPKRTRTSRREFVRLLGLGSAAAMIASATRSAAAEKGEFKNKQEGMAYRRLGRTNLWISEICLGGNLTPDERVVREALDRGVNYVDTSSTYGNGNSEIDFGKILKGQRDKFFIATKFHPDNATTADDLVKEAEGSLTRLQMDCVDIMHVHGVKSPEQSLQEKVLKAFEKLKKDGKIRFMGASGHKNVMDIIPGVIKTDKYDMVMINYNVYGGIKEKKDYVSDDVFSESGFNSLFDLARERDVGVIAMKVQAGGDHQKLDKYLTENATAAQAKIKWALSRKEVAGACTNIMNLAHLREDLAAAGAKLTATERDRLRNFCMANSDEVCRMCGTCEGVCPNGIRISDTLRYKMYARNYGRADTARQQYASLPEASRFDSCADCGRCEDACPYGVSIRQGMRTAHEMLA